MNETTYDVNGLSCQHCVNAVTGQLTKLPGVTGVDVDLDTGKVTLSSVQPLDTEAVRAAFTVAGPYEILQ